MQKDFHADRVPLVCAADKGHRSIVELLYKKFPAADPGLALQVAAENGHAAVVDFFLENRVVDNREGAFSGAAKSGHSHIMKKLLARTDRMQQDIFFHGICADKDNEEVVDILHSQRILNPQRMTFTFAENAGRGHLLTVARMLHYCGSSITSPGALRDALENKHELIATLLLDNKNPVDRPWDWRELEFAVIKNSLFLVKKLVIKYAMPINESVLRTAAERGRYDLLPFLVKHALSSNIEHNGLAIRIEEKRYSAALSLLINLYVKGYKLESSAEYPSDQLLWLLDNGAVPSAVAISRAAQFHRADLLNIFFSHGFTVHQQQLNNLLCETSDLSVAHSLIEQEADVNARHAFWSWNPLYKASINSSCKLASYLLSKGANIVVQSGWDGNTCLHTVPDDLNCLQLLLDHAPSGFVNSVNSKGNTALHNAAKKNKKSAHCGLFVAAGADINRCNNKNCTPLDKALRKMRKEEDCYAMADRFKTVMLLKKLGGQANAERYSDDRLTELLQDLPDSELL